MAPYGTRAKAHPRGGIDLSQGTPVDPTPELVQHALQANSNSPGYPVTTGTAELRTALKKYSSTILGVSGEFDVLPTIGSKELVALLPFLLRASTVLIPEIAYPTYRVGGLIAESQVIEVGIDPFEWPISDLAWINNPSNPTGRVHSDAELDAVIAWSRKTGTVIASDECYFSFPDTEQSTSILRRANGDNTNLLALHSLSKRSNIAGYRGGFVVGDPKLISKLLEIRKHMGMMVPQPIQLAMVAALSDESHVEVQAHRYRERRKKLTAALSKNGFVIEHSRAGLYIWCTRNESDWETVDWFAERGILVTPGNFYGGAGARHVRIALTATDAQIDEAVTRLT